MPAFFRYSNLHIGIIASCFVAGTSVLLGLPPDIPLLVVAGAGTFIAYQVDRVGWFSPEDEVNQPARMAWMKAHRGYIWGSLIWAIGIVLFMLPQLRPAVIVVVLGLGALTGVQLFPVLSGHRRLKHWGRLKPLVLSVAWAIGGVVLPVLQADQTITIAVMALVVYRIGYVLPNMVISDWPDRAGDQEAGIHTWAVQYSDTSITSYCKIITSATFIGAIVITIAFGASYLLAIDAIACMGMLHMFRTPLPISWGYYLALDGLVAWPLVPALIYLWG